MTDSNDPIIFQTPGVSVSKTIVRVSGTSYPINGIGSVSIQRANTPGAVPAIIALVLGAWWVFSNHGNYGYIPAGLAVLTTIGALFPESALVLRTASGDQRVLEARDKSFLRKIQGAIEEAVAQRG